MEAEEVMGMGKNSLDYKARGLNPVPGSISHQVGPGQAISLLGLFLHFYKKGLFISQ